MCLEASHVPVNPTREQLTARTHRLNSPRSIAAGTASMLGNLEALTNNSGGLRGDVPAGGI